MKISSEKLWYTKNLVSTLLIPVSWLFRVVSYARKASQKKSASKKGFEDTYVFVVGNLTVGGAGKTPFVTYLVEQCKKANLSVGVISRGYKRKTGTLIEVSESSMVEEVGDEALMLKQQTTCPVVVSTDRCEAAKYLYDKYQPSVIVSDDGLQHYRLSRDCEIVVVDGEREFGNGHCLPAGPLREPISRLKSVDIVVSNGENDRYEYHYTTLSSEAISLSDEYARKSIEEFQNTRVHAVAGIGYPKRFFSMLENYGMGLIPHAFADHHNYKPKDLEFNDNLPILMTEKDAVKCRGFANDAFWYIPIKAIPNAQLETRIKKILEELS